MQDNLLFLGIDAGSTTVKAVLIDADGAMVSHAIARVSGDYQTDIAKIRGCVLADFIAETNDKSIAGMEIAATAATGYGQALVSDTVRTVSEISCHARGAHALNAHTRVVIDIGGQDMKVVSVSPKGKPLDFLMNDKCAAGTGRFLDVMARALGVDISEYADLAEASTSSIRVNSMCTVFAESEVISLLARGVSKADVANGLLDSIAERVVSMVRRLAPAVFAQSTTHSASGSPDNSVVMTGGGALNRALVAAISRRLNRSIAVSAHSQLAGALGAALFARDSARS